MSVPFCSVCDYRCTDAHYKIQLAKETSATEQILDYDLSSASSVPQSQPAKESVTGDNSERSVLLVDLGYSLYAFGLAKESIRDDLDHERVHRELQDLYSRLGLPVPPVELRPAMFKETRRHLTAERDRECLDIGMHLAAAYSVGLVKLVQKGTVYEDQATVQLSRIANDLDVLLTSLGVLGEVQRTYKTAEVLIPTATDSIDS